ncbi:DoxX family protein [Robertkochia flava]|uniref:DoxX family protein n=1 Tax=Robertkochia flava TaxID=3447986 RepID=UPI001CC92E4C|nr:hypothetical protein [Robertkochia marina]
MEAWHYYLMAILYILAGILHFIKSKWYIAVIPEKFPAKLLLVYLSGIAEIYLGIMLFLPSWKLLALSGIILMLLAFLPVHIYMLKHPGFRKKFPAWALLSRISLQFLLMYWAYSYM